jgi:hypothetical protein
MIAIAIPTAGEAGEWPQAGEFTSAGVLPAGDITGCLFSPGDPGSQAAAKRNGRSGHIVRRFACVNVK